MGPNNQQPGQVFSPQGGNIDAEPSSNILQEPKSSLPPKTPPQPSSSSDPDKKRRIVIVVLGFLALIFIVAAIIAILNNGGSDEIPVDEQTNSQIHGPQPAQAIDVEQTNNSINNDLSGLDDSADFSKDDLSDDSLKL